MTPIRVVVTLDDPADANPSTLAMFQHHAPYVGWITDDTATVASIAGIQSEVVGELDGLYPENEAL